jgi:hypothetical protein
MFTSNAQMLHTLWENSEQSGKGASSSDNESATEESLGKLSD